ncbi:Rqc2 family fibronectin-binding protein [Syntrophomonas wolfei]|uniref:Rqc2 family fibronectin-binding protein n=1 Tax=Syntrophomonas wolfei TaxID=863 RepID=UPI0023EF62BF|nr:NFACT RNA binding domain-containing protein [Syntrophomonas wolfei]
MPFDGITIRALCQELNPLLNGARIDKIFQPEKDELVLSVRTAKSGSLRLMLSANSRWARLHIDSIKKPNPTKPPAFCMLLRKYLEGGKIQEIKQVDFERIIHIDIEALDDFREWKIKRLICEFMGRHSNIILVNPENNLIIDAIKKYGHDRSSHREVLPGKEYVSPPQQGKLNPLQASYEDFVRLMWKQGGNNTLANSFFQVFSGISPFSSSEFCWAAGLEPLLPVEQCGELEFSRLFHHSRTVLQNIEQAKLHPVAIYSNLQPLEFAPYPILSLNESGYKSLNFSSINEACDRYYNDSLKMIRLESMKVNLSRNIKIRLDKAYKKQFFQEGDLAKAYEKLKYKEWGEMLTAYAFKFQKGDKTALIEDFYQGEEVEISLDPRYTPIQNAQKYFKIYNKSRNAIKHLKQLLASNQEEIDYLESIIVLIAQAETPEIVEEIREELEKQGYVKEHTQRARKELLKSQPRRFLSSDGLEILVGRNNQQNDFLSLKQAERQDLWLHSSKIPGTHVIIKLPKTISSINDVPDHSLEEAADLAAYFSKAKEADKVPVDYTFRVNVRKPSGAKPGMVIYDNYWTIIANPRSENLSRLLAESEIRPLPKI